MCVPPPPFRYFHGVRRAVDGRMAAAIGAGRLKNNGSGGYTACKREKSKVTEKSCTGHSRSPVCRCRLHKSITEKRMVGGGGGYRNRAIVHEIIIPFFFFSRNPSNSVISFPEIEYRRKTGGKKIRYTFSSSPTARGNRYGILFDEEERLGKESGEIFFFLSGPQQQRETFVKTFDCYSHRMTR